CARHLPLYGNFDYW
nr:immunoglobulin heavy chain junction region [Mus musculus]